MELELGKCYLVIKNDWTKVIFRFLGGKPNGPQELQVEVDGKLTNLDKVLKGGYQDYWEVDCEEKKDDS